MVVKKIETGFTLIELMIVIVVVAVLVAVGYPSYQDHVIKTRRSDAKNMLMDVASRQEQYYMDNSTYTTLSNLGYSANTVSSENGHYNVSVTASDATSYTLQAVPQGSQASDPCGNFTLNNLGVKGVSGTDNRCW